MASGIVSVRCNNSLCYHFSKNGCKHQNARVVRVAPFGFFKLWVCQNYTEFKNEITNIR
jgi:hypothetical protein